MHYAPMPTLDRTRQRRGSGDIVGRTGWEVAAGPTTNTGTRKAGKGTIAQWCIYINGYCFGVNLSIGLKSQPWKKTSVARL